MNSSLLRAAIRIDIQPAAPGVTGVHRQSHRLASTLYVGEDTLHALFMKLVVHAKGDEVSQQRLMIDLWAFVVNDHAGPVRLASDQAVGF